MRRSALSVPVVLSVGVLLLAGCSSAASDAGPTEQVSGRVSASGAPTQTEEAAEAAPPTVAPSSAAAPGSKSAPADWKKSADGHWCYYPMEDSADACWKIEYPTIEYDSGTIDRLNRYGDPSRRADGTIEYSVTDAPLGTYYPAGVKIRGASVKCGKISQDRMYSSQSGDCMLRQEDIVKEK